MIRLAILIACITFAAEANAQDQEKSSPPKVEFVEPAKSIQEALARQQEAADAADAKLLEAQVAYSKLMEKVNSQLIADLKQLAKKAAANGDIAESAKAWEAVLARNVKDAEAIEFFNAIGNRTAVKNSIAKANTQLRTLSPVLSARDLAGDWKGTWGTTGNQISFSIDGDGRINNDKLSVIDGRLFWLRKSSREQIQLIVDVDRLIVLGWSGSPLSIKASPPSNVGIAYRHAD